MATSSPRDVGPNHERERSGGRKALATTTPIDTAMSSEVHAGDLQELRAVAAPDGQPEPGRHREEGA